MTPPTRMPLDAFAERLASLESADFSAFVAALFRARGWDVERDGQVLRLERGGTGPEGRSILAIADGTDLLEGAAIPDVEDIDGLVAARRSADVERLASDVDARGPEDLYDLLLYGIDRDSADALCREHLGRGVTAGPGERDEAGFEPSASTRAVDADEERDRTDPRVQSRAGESGIEDHSATTIARPTDDGNDARGPRLTRRRAVSGVVLVVLLAATATIGIGGFGGIPFAASTPAGDATEIETPTQSDDSRADTASDTDSTTHMGLMVAPTSSGDPGASQAGRRYVNMTPTCERPPELVALIIVGALRNNDPETDDGVRTAWNFSSRASPGATYRSFATYLSGDQFEPLYTHRGLEISTHYAEHGDRVFRVSVTDAAGNSFPYHVALTRQEGGRLDGCWVLAGIVVEW